MKETTGGASGSVKRGWTAATDECRWQAGGRRLTGRGAQGGRFPRAPGTAPAL